MKLYSYYLFYSINGNTLKKNKNIIFYIFFSLLIILYRIIKWNIINNNKNKKKILN